MTYLEQLLQNPGAWNTEVLQGARKEYEEMKSKLKNLEAQEKKTSTPRKTTRRKTAS